MSGLALLAILALTPDADAAELKVGYDSMVNLETGAAFTRTDCLYGNADCTGQVVQIRYSNSREPHTYLEFSRTLQITSTDLAFGRVTPDRVDDLTFWESALGFLRKTLVVQAEDGATWEFQLVSEDEAGAVLRYNQVAPSTADAAE